MLEVLSYIGDKRRIVVAVMLLASAATPLGYTVQTAKAAPTCENMDIAKVMAIGHQGSNIPANTVDNSLGTRWSHEGIGSWITANMGEQKTICSVGIAWYKGDSRVNNFVISTSADGSSYTNVYSGKNSGKTKSLETYVFAEKAAQYVKITVNGNNQNLWASITEIDVYGYTPVDSSAPYVEITNPARDSTVIISTSGKITVHGVASDEMSGVRIVEVRVESGAYVAATPTAPGDWSAWSAIVDVGTSDTYRIVPRATDNADNQAWNSIYVTVQDQTSDKLLYDDFEAATYEFTDGQTSPDEKWINRYNGYGLQGVKREGGPQIFYAYPMASTKSSETHASLTISSTKYANAEVEWSMRTDKQLRTGSSPNAWEAAWGMIKYVDSMHHYYLILKPNNQYEFGKKDYLPGETGEHQIFLKTGPLPSGVTWQFGKWYNVKTIIEGTKITAYVDGTELFDFNDDGSTGKRAQTAVLAGEGSFGMYEEDAVVTFDDIYIKPL